MPILELVQRRNILHRKSSAQTMLGHALEDVQLGPVALVSSFGADSIVLLHMVAQINRNTPVIFLDTLMLYRETLAYQTDVAKVLNLTDIRVVSPDRATLLERDVDCLLHQSKPDECCALRKEEPLDAALVEFGAWITGRKRHQGSERENIPLFEKDGQKIKLNPLANWTAKDVSEYIAEHDLPRHPLVKQGYPSIGCRPCTTRVQSGEHERSGRWRNSAKTECGIHRKRIA